MRSMSDPLRSVPFFEILGEGSLRDIGCFGVSEEQAAEFVGISVFPFVYTFLELADKCLRPAEAAKS
jgi:hypothetical protein